MEIMLNNLVSNDVKYNVDHGKSFISLKSEKYHVFLFVKNTEIRMSEGEQKLLFRSLSA